ncbi:hypothetical protein J6590_074470 [Homalodisca vitripennis]|nr:hypothetical protein J6590_074470 [Homalodisca vitripennis]
MARAKKTSDSETLKRQRDLAKERQRKHRAKMTEEELELKRKAGHGKGPMDGVGGVLKRMADEVVRHGTDITCASDFVNTLKKRTKIYLIEIDSSTVDEMKKEVKATVIPPIKNITLARQITWGSNSIMYSRSLS